MKNIFKTFSKNYQTHTYFNVKSNHARSIIKHIANAVNIRINRSSSNKIFFHENKKNFNEAQEKIGFQQRPEYQEQMINNKVTEHRNSNDDYCRNDSSNYRLGDWDNNINSNKKLSIGKER